MKKIIAAIFAVCLLSFVVTSEAQLAPCTNCVELNWWYFLDTNWFNGGGYPPVKFTNIVSVPGVNGNWMFLDTTNATPAYLLYHVVETNLDSTTFTNITPSAGSISLWFSPDWTSTNQGGTGPTNFANLISMGQTGTNGPWWAWYLSPDGCTIYFGSQTNGGSASVYLSAPVSFLTTNWYNLALSYGPAGTTFFTNGVQVTNGTGITNWPGPDVTFFSIGSDSNGLYQARGTFSDLETYNYQLDSGTISDSFGFLAIFYGLSGTGDGGSPTLIGAPPALTPAPRWFSGLGDLQIVTANTGCTNNSKVWFTNTSATLTNGAMAITFTIAGGSNSALYDVFGATVLAGSTNTQWAWLGEGPNCTTYQIGSLTNSAVFLVLAGTQDTDGDGLTDAFETLVSHTNPNFANTYSGLPDAWIALNGLVGTNGLPGLDPDFDGLNNGQEYLYGTKPRVPEGIATWVSSPAGISGIP